MGPDRRDLISRLHHAALARPPEKRGAFLKEACEGDEVLRQEVDIHHRRIGEIWNSLEA